VHYVANPHPDFGIWLTWPFHVNHSGIAKTHSLKLQAQASRDLQDLIAARQNEESKLRTLIPG
jgi:hypothetical protein